MPQHPVPSYRQQKRSTGSIGFSQVRDQRIYFPGPFNSDQSRQAYKAFVAQWAVSGALPVSKSDISIAELCARFIEHGRTYYRDSTGAPTGELENFVQAFRPLLELFSDLPVDQFGPQKLAAVRGQMIGYDWARTRINKQIGRLKSVFKWGASLELISAEIFHGLQTLAGLRRGRSGAKETEPIRPVEDPDISAAKKFLQSPVCAMIDIQLLSACRPGEVVQMRACDIDRTGKIWIYKPQQHKGEHHGLSRNIYLGPEAQRILQPFILKKAHDDFLFDPRDAEAERYAACQVHRRPRQKPKQRKSDRTLGEFYTPDSYRRAITRACQKAGCKHWHPHQLRHTAATRLRKEYGLDAARVVLGHRSAKVTEVYAELDHAKALDILSKIG